MAKFFDDIIADHAEFIGQQSVFFLATSPADGRINLSPKGGDSFRILDSKRVAWLDLGGSGNETAAHLKENGRVTVMFCSFGPTPLILRLYGMARAVQRRHAEWPELFALFSAPQSARQLFTMQVDSVQSSCGYGIPIAESMQPRTRLVDWVENMTWPEHEEKIRARGWDQSIDGLPTGIFED